MIPCALVPREPPLPPSAAVGVGAAAQALARRLLRGDLPLRGLSVVFAEGVLLVQGPGDALPWCPGVEYLGLEPESGALLLPTTRRLELDGRLVERALRQGLRLPAGLLAILGDRRVLPLAGAQPATTAALGWFLARAGGEAA